MFENFSILSYLQLWLISSWHGYCWRTKVTAQKKANETVLSFLYHCHGFLSISFSPRAWLLLCIVLPWSSLKPSFFFQSHVLAHLPLSCELVTSAVPFVHCSCSETFYNFHRCWHRKITKVIKNTTENKTGHTISCTIFQTLGLENYKGKSRIIYKFNATNY